MRTQHVYALGGRFCAGSATARCRLTGQRAPYYRCRFPAEYAIANKIDHPRNVFVREREVLPDLDDWLATEFAPRRIEATIEQMAAAQDNREASSRASSRHTGRSAERRKWLATGLRLMRAATSRRSASGSARVKAERLQAEAALRGTTAQARLTSGEIKAIVERFTSIAAVIRDAGPADKAEIYRRINLTLTYQPEAGIVQAQARLSADSHGVMVGVRGGP